MNTIIKPYPSAPDATCCPLVTAAMELVELDPVPGSRVNETATLLRAARAERWLLETYLQAWLDGCAELPKAGYPLAQKIVHRLQALPALLTPALDTHCDAAGRSFALNNVTDCLQRLCVETFNDTNECRSLQWGIWARDPAADMAAAFKKVPFLDPAPCKELTKPTMYAAYLMSQIITDDGVAEEIEAALFDGLHGALGGILLEIRDAVEA